MSIKKGRLRSSGLIAAPVQFPPGTVISFAGSTAPDGWRICDGSAISRTDYAGLFAAIGSAWGSGDGSTTFHLPDLRGRFLRGVDNDQGRDPDRASRTAANSGGNTGDAVGSIQGHAFQTHNHTHDTGGNNATGTFHQSSVSAEASFIFTGSTGASGTHAQPSANETRPVNANVNFIIKV